LIFQSKAAKKDTADKIPLQCLFVIFMNFFKRYPNTFELLIKFVYGIEVLLFDLYYFALSPYLP